MSETRVTKQMRKRIIQNRMYKSVLDRLEHKKQLIKKKRLKRIRQIANRTILKTFINSII